MRLMVQRIDSGKVKETMSPPASALELHFAQKATVMTVTSAFTSLVTVCLDANPFKRGHR
jgi:hypothetical protein